MEKNQTNYQEEVERELWIKPPDGDWEYLDHEDESNSIKDLIQHYIVAYGPGYQFEVRRPDDFLDDVEEF